MPLSRKFVSVAAVLKAKPAFSAIQSFKCVGKTTNAKGGSKLNRASQNLKNGWPCLEKSRPCLEKSSGSAAQLRNFSDA